MKKSTIAFIIVGLAILVTIATSIFTVLYNYKPQAEIPKTKVLRDTAGTEFVVLNKQYILKLAMSQSHFTTDLAVHLKDHMNEVEFELPVSEEFYNAVSEGDEIVDKFRAGSFVLYGSLGDWRLKVLSKETR